MAKLLIAASTEPGEILARILAGHELVRVDTVAKARQLLARDAFALIVCTVLFDESRMFDLLRFAKSNARCQSTPFVCARLRPHVINSAIALEAVAFTCRELGAVAFLDLADFKKSPQRELRQAIERLLPAD